MIQGFSVSESEGTLTEFCWIWDVKGSNLVAFFFLVENFSLRPERQFEQG